QQHLESAGRQATDFPIPAVNILAEAVQFLDARLNLGRSPSVPAALLHERAYGLERGLHFALTATLDEPQEPVPGRPHRSKRLPALADARRLFEQAVGQKLLEPRRYVRAGEAQRFGDFLRVSGAREKEKERMNLRDRAIDAPTRAHFAPVENEAFH